MAQKSGSTAAADIDGQYKRLLGLLKSNAKSDDLDFWRDISQQLEKALETSGQQNKRLIDENCRLERQLQEADTTLSSDLDGMRESAEKYQLFNQDLEQTVISEEIVDEQLLKRLIAKHFGQQK